MNKTFSIKPIHIQSIILLQALVATFGSLYYSTFGDPVKNIASWELFNPFNSLPPCDLCWFARILMYPIVFIAVIGLLKKDKTFTDYILPFAYTGIVLEVYHYSLQMFGVRNVFSCSAFNPCSMTDVKYLGFITLPFLGFIAFAVILGLSLYNSYLNKKAADKV